MSRIARQRLGDVLQSDDFSIRQALAGVEQIGDRVSLHDLPEHAPDPLLSVIEIEVEGRPECADPEQLDVT